MFSGQKKPQPKEIAYKVLEPNAGNGTHRLQALINRTAIGTDPKLVTDQDNIKYNVVKQYKVLLFRRLLFGYCITYLLLYNQDTMFRCLMR